MSNEISELQSTFNKVLDNVMELAKGQVLTGESLTRLQNLLGEHQDAINKLKKSCEAFPMPRKS